MSESPDALLLKKRARRRLIGAVALVLFVVIALPMVLDKDPKPTQNELSVQIPRQDSSAFKSRVLPQVAAPEKPDAITADGHGQARSVAVPGVPDTKQDSKEQERAAEPVVQPKADPVAQADMAPKAESKPPVLKSAVPSTGGDAQRVQAVLSDEAWMIPLGAFSNRDNVRQLQSKAAAAGVKTVTEALKTANGEKIRVRGGPFKSKAEADKARDALKRAGIDAGAVTVR